MSFVIKTKDDELIWVDAVLSFSEDLSGSVTSHPIQDGSTISDHIVNNNTRFALSGVITDWGFHQDRQSSADIIGGILVNANSVEQPVAINYEKPSQLSRLLPEPIAGLLSKSSPEVELDATSRPESVKDIRERLRAIRANKEFISLLRLSTNQILEEEIESLVITGLNFDESPDMGEAVSFSMAVERITVVRLATANIPSVVSAGLEKALSDKDKKGTTSGGSATTEENLSSQEDPKKRTSILKQMTDPLRDKLADGIGVVSKAFGGN